MQLIGYFNRKYRRNEKSGLSRFTLKTADGRTITCEGICINYPKYAPLVMDGSYKDGIFTFESVYLYDKDKTLFENFLSGGYFTGIGKAGANNLISVLPGDFLKIMRSTPLQEFISENELNSYVHTLRRIAEITAFEDLYDYIKDHGGSFFNALKMYEKFASDSLSVIKRNPYTLVYAGAKFSVCEKIAKEQGISECDKRRIDMVLYCSMENIRNNGNTKVSFHDLCQAVRYVERDSEYTTSPLFIAESLIKGEYVLENTKDNTFISTKEDYDAESGIAFNLKRLARTKRPLNNITSTNEIEIECGITYSDEQKETFDTLNETGTYIITGGPGTGKTSVLNGILKKYEKDNPYNKIVLCAPTGCAARRMQETTGREASTIHKLLNIQPFSGEYTRTSKLDANCVVVDECSMIDTFIMNKLLASINDGTLLILLGDSDQLTSVGAGNILSDMIESGVIKVYRLTKIFRQKNGNLIIDNSKRVINGDNNLECGTNFIIKTVDNEDSLISSALNICKKVRMNGDTKLYTPSRAVQFKSGSINMNKSIQNALHKEDEESLVYGYYTFSVGDRVIFNKNNYELGYYNGQEGVIKNIQVIHEKYHITIDSDGTAINLSGTDIDDIDLGYIITAHKSQGGECKNAVILVPKRPASLLKRQLLYVEITRAKENVVIIEEKGALNTAISSIYENKRTTGLLDKISLAFA